MTPIGSCSFRVPDRARLGWDGRETGPVVVWLRGDHDLSTDDALMRNVGACHRSGQR